MHEHSCRDQVAACTSFKVPKTVAPLGSASVAAAAKSSLGSLVSVKGSSHHAAPSGSAGSGVHASAHGLPSMAAGGGSSSAGIGDINASAAAAAAAGAPSVVSTPTSSLAATPLASPLFSASNR